MKKYQIIYADPPWSYGSNSFPSVSKTNAYPLMKTADICALPVKDIVQPNALLFLWTTMTHIPDAPQVIDAWGFRYITNGFTWVKTNKKSGTPFMGMGYWTRQNAELCLIAKRGRLSRRQPSASVTPLAGLEWFIALTLWLFNSTMWSAWFGTPAGTTRKEVPQANLKLLSARVSAGLGHRAQEGSQPHDHDSVRSWLASYRQSEPEHYAILYLYYCSWCEGNSCQPLKERNFYTRLGELGTRKFRDGRNGPTLYELPQGLIASCDEEVK